MGFQMATNFYDKLSDLQAAQIKTHTLLTTLTEKVDRYVVGDDARHKEILTYRLESTKALAEVVAIVHDMKRDVDRTTCIDIPTLQREQASQKATLNNHSWLLRAVIGVTLLAVLGSGVTTLATCECSERETQATQSVVEDAGVVDSNLDEEAL